MGKWVVKQPNGRYALFSTVVDDFVEFDEDMPCIVAALIGSYDYGPKQAVRSVLIADRDDYTDRVGQRTNSDGSGRWQEALETIREVHSTRKAAAYAAAVDGNWKALIEIDPVYEHYSKRIFIPL